ncbi:MAG: hypothetical protein K2P81_12870 [Bacteriovoracaceae bacterium]|nr:hypothetical protein [Bacteriovoracaceae bacterium]
MNTDKVLIKDLINTIKKYQFRIAGICILTATFFLQLTFWIEKQYVSTFEINVYSKYFQSPLISGVIPDMFNIPEMRFAIDSMVKEAISDDFVDQIGRRYNIYTGTKDEREIARERQDLRDRFSYFSTGGQSYQVSFSHSDPFVAKKVAEETLDVVSGHIVDKRISTIELVKEVMIKKLNSFNASQKFTQRGAEKALASKSPDVLKDELLKINTSIEALGVQLKENHPKIRVLKQRKATILSWLKEYDIKDLSQEKADLPFEMTHDKVISEQLSSKFYAKYHDFNIALEIEKKSLQSYIGVIKKPQLPVSPIWPKKRLFASLGFIIGLIFAFIYVFIQEVLLPSKMELLIIEAKKLNAPILGEFPIEEVGEFKSLKKDIVRGTKNLLRVGR